MFTNSFEMQSPTTKIELWQGEQSRQIGSHGFLICTEAAASCAVVAVKSAAGHVARARRSLRTFKSLDRFTHVVEDGVESFDAL